MSIKITGTGSCIPNNIIENKEFIKNNFFDKDGNPYPNSNLDIIDKFQAITGIQKRRYADKDQKASDLAADAGLKAIKSAGINKEELDYIIVSHNFGDVEYGTNQYIALPSVATMVKHKMNIKNV